jgi:hypothetical protein
MSDLSKIAKNLERFKVGVNSHDRENPDHPAAYGIGLSAFDAERLGFQNGEELWPGVILVVDGGQSANFRVLCLVENAGKPEAEIEQEITRAVGQEVSA